MKTKFDSLDIIEILVCLVAAYFVRAFYDWVIAQLSFELPPVFFYLFLLAFAFSVMMLIHNTIFKPIREGRFKK